MDELLFQKKKKRELKSVCIEFEAEFLSLILLQQIWSIFNSVYSYREEGAGGNSVQYIHSFIHSSRPSSFLVVFFFAIATPWGPHLPCVVPNLLPLFFSSFFAIPYGPLSSSPTIYLRLPPLLPLSLFLSLFLPEVPVPLCAGLWFQASCILIFFELSFSVDDTYPVGSPFWPAFAECCNCTVSAGSFHLGRFNYVIGLCYPVLMLSWIKCG